jgi:hypothetical protein
MSMPFSRLARRSVQVAFAPSLGLGAPPGTLTPPTMIPGEAYEIVTEAPGVPEHWRYTPAAAAMVGPVLAGYETTTDNRTDGSMRVVSGQVAGPASGNPSRLAEAAAQEVAGGRGVVIVGDLFAGRPSITVISGNSLQDILARARAEGLGTQPVVVLQAPSQGWQPGSGGMAGAGMKAAALVGGALAILGLVMYSRKRKD